MERRLCEVLAGREGNYLNPFFWQNGASEETLREEIGAIYDSGIREMCVESRVHPDFLGEGWWKAMDVILEEARERSMRVWVLDDAHFPTGYANGRVEAHPYARKRYLDCMHIDAAGPLRGCGFLIRLEEGEELLAVTAGRKDDAPHGPSAGRKDDAPHGLSAGRKDDAPHVLSEVREITELVRDGILYWDVPEGVWTVNVIKVTDRSTGRKNYINSIDKKAVGLLLDTVYEAHYQRYRDSFGREFAGFFSDEPEIGNVLSEYGYEARIGIPGMTLPWCGELEARLKEKWGAEYGLRLTSLWSVIEGVSPSARYEFMDAVTDLYGRNFSGQIGEWCRERGVEYIGHVIEDNGCHSRLGLGTGHFFKAQAGQDMGGIDVVLQQVRPGLDACMFATIGGKGLHDGRFFHYGLAKLGVSAAQLDPLKGGRCMCEIFGAYGWSEGVKLMKWLADHMLVRGVNYFVPHAFSMKDFPDQDCPPHFYAHGLNPQYPYFRALCQYMNRVSHLIQGGRSVPRVAVFYPACAEWMGDSDGLEVPGMALMQHQIDYDALPESALLGAVCEEGRIRVGERQYDALLFPRCEYLPDAVLDWCDRALEAGIRIYMGQQAPKRAGDLSPYRNPKLKIAEDWDAMIEKEGLSEVSLQGSFPHLRYYHYRQKGGDFYLFFQEAAGEAADTFVKLPKPSAELSDPGEGQEGGRQLARYDAWDNRLVRVPYGKEGFRLRLAPGEAAVYYEGEIRKEMLSEGYEPGETLCRIPENGTLRLIPYDGGQEKELLFTKLANVTGAEGEPGFSGRMAYELVFEGERAAEAGAEPCFLDCGEVFETAEVWLNGKRLGLRIAAPYVFEIPEGALLPGENRLRIEVTNTLVHAVRDYMSSGMPVEPSGLLGPVTLRKADM